MKIGILKETAPGEKRVALIPDSVKRLVKAEYEVVVESGAGAASMHSDEAYKEAGATIADGASGVCTGADLIVKVQPPTEEEVGGIPEGKALVSILYPMSSHGLVNKLAGGKITSIGLDVVPRTTLAQAMDVLSSMSTITGYKSVLAASDRLPKMFPMMMTAAGTIAPAKVLVIGAGVAGLQACATAKKLGGVVEAFDVRAAAKEQVESFGVKFVEVKSDETGDAEGGYAKEMSDEYKKAQAELLSKHIKKNDVVITTALVPGRPAPKIISKEQVESMKEGSVIIDIAADFGGNTEVTEVGKEVVVDGVTVIGRSQVDMIGDVSIHASQMFSKNVENLIKHLTTKDGLTRNMEDEITAGSIVTDGGEVIHGMTRESMGL